MLSHCHGDHCRGKCRCGKITSQIWTKLNPTFLIQFLPSFGPPWSPRNSLFSLKLPLRVEACCYKTCNRGRLHTSLTEKTFAMELMIWDRKEGITEEEKEEEYTGHKNCYHPPSVPSAPPYKHPDIACVIPSFPLCSTTDAHVALQQLSHHVPYQVLPPNGGERKWGGGRIWVEKDAGWVLNLERRDGIMNINIISFSVLRNEMCSRCTCAHSGSFLKKTKKIP